MYVVHGTTIYHSLYTLYNNTRENNRAVGNSRYIIYVCVIFLLGKRCKFAQNNMSYIRKTIRQSARRVHILWPMKVK